MSADTNIEFIERYQRILDEDPTSRAFAPLAEAYRRNGNVQRALQICRQGLSHNPDFAGGWYQLGKIFNHRKDFDRAIEAFKKAVSIAPENIQSWKSLGQLYLQQKQTSEALHAFKQVLFINPKDPEAIVEINDLEGLTAADYSADLFQFQNKGVSPQGFDKKNFSERSDLNEKELHHAWDIFSPAEGSQETDEFSVREELSEASEFSPLRKTRENSEAVPPDEWQDRGPSERGRKGREAQTPPLRKPALRQALLQIITMVDALTLRNEFAKARDVLQRAFIKYGELPELKNRWEMVLEKQESSLDQETPEIIHPVAPRVERVRNLKINRLEKLLSQLEKTNPKTPAS